jgi:hypothetical protein
MLRIFERRILRMIYSNINDNFTWRMSYNNQLLTLWNDLDIVNVIIIIRRRRMSWLEHVFRMQEHDPCRKLTVLKQEGTRRVGKPE